MKNKREKLNDIEKAGNEAINSMNNGLISKKECDEKLNILIEEIKYIRESSNKVFIKNKEELCSMLDLFKKEICEL
jgi:hypothetical protein